MNDWFTIESIDQDTYVISEYKHWEETHCYLLCGTKRALLIDTGLGVANIKEVEVWGFEHISVEEEKLGLKGSPTRVWKSITKGAKAAGKVFEVEPSEAADIIVEKLKEKFII